VSAADPVGAPAGPGLRVVFAGTPAFARTALEAIGASRHRVVGVLTQPDRPAGRGQKLQPSDVKTAAMQAGWPVHQPRSLRLDGRFADDAQLARAWLEARAPDVVVVAAYGLILPRWALECPRLGCLNIHGSLLPRWRGAAPIQRAVEAGDLTTGITIMQMDEGLDTGAMLMSESCPIEPTDTSATLHDRLSLIGARLVVHALDLAQQGRLAPAPQPPGGATYAHKIDKDEAALDWRLDAAVLERRVRAFDPFPGALARLPGGEPLKVWRAATAGERAGGAAIAGAPAGTVLSATPAGVEVACGGGALRLLELQRPGGKRLAAADFLAGRPIEAGVRFELPGAG
jgi:methionyl-tRNA formyltransferase